MNKYLKYLLTASAVLSIFSLVGFISLGAAPSQTQQENTLVGADLAASITNLQQASTATDAILSVTGKILSTLNLLDFLK